MYKPLKFLCSIPDRTNEKNFFKCFENKRRQLIAFFLMCVRTVDFSGINASQMFAGKIPCIKLPMQ